MLAVIVFVDIQLCQLAHGGLDDVRARVASNLRVSSNIVLGRAEQFFDTHDRTLSGISEVIGMRGGLGDLEIHRLLARRHAITPDIERFQFVAPDGRLVATSLDFPAPTLDVSHREYFRTPAAAFDSGLYIGPRLSGVMSGTPFIPASRPVVDGRGRVTGVAVAAIKPDGLMNILRGQALPDDYSLRLFLRSGHALACLPQTADCHERDWRQAPLFQSLIDLTPEGHFRSGALFGDEPGSGAYASSAKYPLVVAATVSDRHILAPWRQTALRYLAIGLISNLAIVLIAAFAYRQFRRRRKAVAALAEANVYLEERVASRTEALRLSEARARLFMNTATDAIVVFDAGRRIVEFNAAAEALFGYSADEVIGWDVNVLLPHAEAIPAFGQGQQVDDAGQPVSLKPELAVRAKDGREFFIEVTAGSTGGGESALCVCVIRDVTERRAIERELLRLATTDALTGVLNRGAWTRRSEELASVSRRYGRPLTLMILDADKFKRINDTYGHPAGDAALKALAGAINVRAADVVGRLGGEEFAITLPETDADCGMEFATRLLARIRDCRVTEGEHTLSFTVSIGLTEFDPARDEDLSAIFRRADRALYIAKRRGRDGVVRLDAADEG